MDETLAHWIPDEDLEYDDIWEVLTPYDAKLVMESEGEAEDMYINVRPFLKKFISELKPLYQIVVLTASTSDYADTILNYIDPDRHLFEARFYRENWVKTSDEIYLKDLSIFTKFWSLKDIILVDNSAHWLAPQLNNGYLIKSFHNDKNDRELIYLMKFLKTIYHAKDVRKTLKTTFVLERIMDEEISEKVADLYCRSTAKEYSPSHKSSQISSGSHSEIADKIIEEEKSQEHEVHLSEFPSSQQKPQKAQHESRYRIKKNPSLSSAKSSNSKIVAMNSLGFLLDKIESYEKRESQKYERLQVLDGIQKSPINIANTQKATIAPNFTNK